MSERSTPQPELGFSERVREYAIGHTGEWEETVIDRIRKGEWLMAPDQSLVPIDHVRFELCMWSDVVDAPDDTSFSVTFGRMRANGDGTHECKDIYTLTYYKSGEDQTETFEEFYGDRDQVASHPVAERDLERVLSKLESAEEAGKMIRDGEVISA